MGKLLNELTLETVTDWFTPFHTDEPYLRIHFNRFKITRDFVLDRSGSSEDILDIGAHWLHNAFFYANEGHRVHCVDAPNTMRKEGVQAAARAMDATLHVCKRLEFGDGVNEMDQNSIDTVLMCETIEHLAFNPIQLWTEIYRVLKPGGRIVVTTPNANQWSKRYTQLRRLLAGQGIGIEVAHVLDTGTFGHHWKEYTAGELSQYFAALSPDFRVSRTTFAHLGRVPPRAMSFSLGEEICGDLIFMEVTVPQKSRGIVIRPPWVPQYS
jgi:2-polyprenyl-3-methyl-5-hydroxy-6-metoxy-1,4-benzoquinol methylase